MRRFLISLFFAFSIVPTVSCGETFQLSTLDYGEGGSTSHTYKSNTTNNERSLQTYDNDILKQTYACGHYDECQTWGDTYKQTGYRAPSSCKKDGDKVQFGDKTWWCCIEDKDSSKWGKFKESKTWETTKTEQGTLSDGRTCKYTVTTDACGRESKSKCQPTITPEATVNLVEGQITTCKDGLYKYTENGIDNCISEDDCEKVMGYKIDESAKTCEKPGQEEIITCKPGEYMYRDDTGNSCISKEECVKKGYIIKNKRTCEKPEPEDIHCSDYDEIKKQCRLSRNVMRECFMCNQENFKTCALYNCGNDNEVTEMCNGVKEACSL